MSNIDDVKRHKIAGDLRFLASSEMSDIRLSYADVAKIVMKEVSKFTLFNPREFALALADLIDVAVSKPYVDKDSGTIRCSSCEKPVGECIFPRYVHYCDSCGAMLDEPILRGIKMGVELAGGEW